MARFWVGGGANTNWNATANTNWASASGGANNQTVPDSSQDVTFDGAGAGGNGASVISATITVLSLTFTSGYTATVTVSGSPTIAGNFTDHTAHSWAGASTLIISATSTITSGGKTWPNSVQFTGSNTKTLVGDWTILGTLITTTSTTTINKTTAEVLSCVGWTVTGTTTGTINITITGGTWSGGGTNSVSAINIAGNVTVSGGLNFSTGTLTYVSGSVTTTGSTLTLSGTATLNTNGISWNNITCSASTQTVTNNSLLTVAGTLTIAGSTTFSGTSGFTVATLSGTQPQTRTITLVNTVTYTVTTALNGFNSRTGDILIFTSDHASNKAILTLQWPATQNILANFTRIDASAGQPILTFNGVVTTCINVFTYTDVMILPPKYSRKFGRRSAIYNKAKVVQYI